MSTNSVFMKKEPQNFKIDYSSILKTIPENSYIEPQPDKNNKVEMRWRFLCIPLSNISSSKDGDKQKDKQKEKQKDKETDKEKINVKRLVEISRKKPDSNREYLNKKMKWVETTVDPIFDQFVVKQYYYYSDQ